MTATAHAVQPPAHAPAPPVQRKAEPMADVQEAPQRLLTSLSAVPAVQRACAGCDGDDPAPSLQSAQPSIQRKCGACATEDHEERMPVQPQLEVGPVDDPYEREADDIAGRVMAMRDPGAASQAASSVQRACAACASKSDEVQRAPALPETLMDDDAEVPRMRSQPGGGGERITASAAQLTSGGASLSDQSRSYFESRMGRDLSDVRVHRGSDSDALNSSISARAFTYQNHIWLSRAETDGPSFTMAHELAHVLQQTQPGAVGTEQPMARRDDVTVRRMYWEPSSKDPAWIASEAEGGLGATKRHGRYHTEIQQAINGKNKNIVGEIRVPNASTSGTGPGKYGFADLYWSKNDAVPGLRQDSSGKLVNYVFDKSMKSWPFHPVIPYPRYHHEHRYPRLNAANAFVHCDKAPDEIKIGDVKPGHNESARAKGVSQIGNYFQGIRDVAAATNTAAGSTCWDLKSVGPLTHINNIPKQYDPTKTKGIKYPFKSIELRDGSDKFTPNRRVRGRLLMAKDPNNTGIWVYFLQPHMKDLEKAIEIGAIDRDDNLDVASKRLDRVLKCLRASPKHAKRVCRRPAKADARGPKVRRRLPRPMVGDRRGIVRRKGPKDTSFDVNAWNAMRVGSKKANYATQDKNNLKQTLKDNLGKDLRDKIKFRNGLLDHQDVANDQLGSKATMPTGLNKAKQKKIVSQNKLVEALEFWVSIKAGWMGRIRQIFGTAFVRVMNAAEKFRAKFRKLVAKAKPKHSRKGAIAVAAIKAMVKVILGMTGGVMRRVIASVLGCIETGFEKLMTDFTQGAGIDDLNKKADEVKAFADKLTDDVLPNLEQQINDAVAPIRKHMEDLGKAFSLIGSVVTVATTIAHTIRGATCLSGLSAAGVGAAVTCLLAAGDFVLSLFGLSPIDWLASKMIASCTNRRLMARAMLAFDEVRLIPTAVAREVVRVAKKNAPPPLDKMFCDPDTLKAEPLTMDDFTCQDPYGFGWGDGGTGSWQGDGSGDGAPAGKGQEGGGQPGQAGTPGEGGKAGGAKGIDSDGEAGSGKGGKGASPGKPKPPKSDAKKGEADTPIQKPKGGGTGGGGKANKGKSVQSSAPSTNAITNPVAGTSNGIVFFTGDPATMSSGTEVTGKLSMKTNFGDRVEAYIVTNVPLVFVSADTKSSPTNVTFYIKMPEGETHYGITTTETKTRINLAAGPDAERSYDYGGAP